MLTKSLKGKLQKYQGNAVMKARTICPYCKEDVMNRNEAFSNVEYIKRKGGIEIFFHTDCFQRFMRGEKANV